MTQPLSNYTSGSRNQSHIDDYPQESRASQASTSSASRQSGGFVGGYTGPNGSSEVSRATVNQLADQASKKPKHLPPTASRPAAPPPPAPAPAPAAGTSRSAAECADKAAKNVVTCAAAIGTAAAASPTIIGAAVAGAAAGVVCAEGYIAYKDCLEGAK